MKREHIVYFLLSCCVTYRCSRADECINFNPCFNGAKCVNNQGVYSCVCLPGFSGESCYDGVGLPVAPVDPVIPTKQTVSSGLTTSQPASSLACTFNPCFNQATCVTDGVRISCICAPGFTGESCYDAIPNYVRKTTTMIATTLAIQTSQVVVTLTPSTSSPPTDSPSTSTVSPSTAVPSTSSTQTVFTSTNSPSTEAPVQCSFNPCYNGATCLTQGDDLYWCVCPPDFTGSVCQTDMCTGEDKFHCDDGSCVPLGPGPGPRCDGVAQCGDGSDEVACV